MLFLYRGVSRRASGVVVGSGSSSRIVRQSAGDGRCCHHHHQRRWLATGARGSRGLGWLERYRRGDGGRHLQGPLWDRRIEELEEINNHVFALGSDFAYIDILVEDTTTTTTTTTSDNNDENNNSSNDDNDNDNVADVEDNSNTENGYKKTRLILELATAALPLTTENFLRLAEDDYYTDTMVYRVEKEVGLCLGNLGTNGGSGGHCHPSLALHGSAYLPKTEPLVLSHLPGIVTMITPGVDKVNSRFLLCANEAPHLDGRFVGFGRLQEESKQQVQHWLSTVFVRRGAPIREMRIVGAGLLSSSSSDDDNNNNNSNNHQKDAA